MSVNLLLFLQDLSLPNIKQRLHDGNFPDCEAEILGEYLSIPSGIIKTFKHDCGSDSERLLSKLINHWLNNDSKKSWSRLADAIECCRYGVLAWNLRSMSERPLLSISEKQQSEDEGKYNIIIIKKALFYRFFI